MVSILLKRYLWLIDTIRNSNGGLTLAEINDSWAGSDLSKDCGSAEIDRRTLYNHRVAIADQFGIDINVRRRGPYSKYVIDDKQFHDNEIVDWLLSATATENLIARCRSIADKIILEPADRGAIHLQVITEALKTDTILEIDYQSFHLGSAPSKSIAVEPLALKMFKRRWYLLCQKAESGAMRIYALDRIQKCRLTEHRFIYPCGFNAADYFSNFFGVSTDGYTPKPCRIVLRAYHELPRYLESQPLHHSQEIYTKEDDHTDFSYYMIPSFDFVQELLLHCEQLEVLQPHSLRLRIAEILKKSCGFYK